MDHTHIIFEVAMLLALAFVSGTVLRRLKQPALVGYILVGLLMGPSVLGIIDNTNQISILAEFGILMLLFIIGLELDLRAFERVYKVATGTVLIQIVASLAITGGLGWYLDWPLERVIILSFAISLSSTAVAIRLLEDMDAMKNVAGQTAIGVLVAQDLAIIPMMLIVGSFENGSFNPWSLLPIFFAIGFMVFIIYMLNKRDFKIQLPEWLNVSTQKESSQIIIKALAFCFCGAALSGALGLSASYGAFLAGLLIGSTQNKDKYEHHIRPIFDILMMFFFLSVGLLIDLNFLVDHIGVILVMLLFIFVMKTFVTASALRRLGLSRRNALLKGTVLGQIGEFSFVLAALGLSIGALEDEGYKYIVTLIALSLVCAPLWLKFIERLVIIRAHMYKREAPAHDPQA